MCSRCIHEERCTSCPPPPPPSCSPRPFLYSSVYSCHLFLISPASVRSLLFLPYIVHFLAWNIPFISPVFLKRSLVFPILMSFIYLHCSFKKAFLCLTILWNSAFSGYVFPFLLHLSLLCSAICKASSDNHFAYLFFFFFGMVLVTASCTVLWTSVHSSSGTLSTRSNPLNLFIISTVIIRRLT